MPDLFQDVLPRMNNRTKSGRKLKKPDWLAQSDKQNYSSLASVWPACFASLQNPITSESRMGLAAHALP
jgi:hypothetical protein